jgi:nucleotide-binding universal stress UspA family protein
VVDLARAAILRGDGMYKTILVPLDGSKRAEAILPHVEGLAQRYQARVVLLQVVEPVPCVPSTHGSHYEMWLEETERQLDEVESYLTAWQGEFREKGIDAQVRIEQGAVVAAITNIAKSEGTDLIAMSSHGRTGLGHVFYGSVAAGVLHRADRPLLIIRSV